MTHPKRPDAAGQERQRLGTSEAGGDASPLAYHTHPLDLESGPALEVRLESPAGLAEALKALFRPKAWPECAEQAGDARWKFDASAALHEYLPETLALQARRGGQPTDPDFREALEQIHFIGTQHQREYDDQRWQAHQRFLRERAGQERGLLTLNEGDETA